MVFGPSIIDFCRSGDPIADPKHWEELTIYAACTLTGIQTPIHLVCVDEPPPTYKQHARQTKIKQLNKDDMPTLIQLVHESMLTKAKIWIVSEFKLYLERNQTKVEKIGKNFSNLCNYFTALKEKYCVWF